MDRAFYPEARQAVIDMGIVRRRKVDVASDLPDKRIADITVELDDELGARSSAPSGPGRAARSALPGAARRRTWARGRWGAGRGADAPGRDGRAQGSLGRGHGENVFALVRRIGQAKAALAADYAAQLSHSVGKVVFFAKHLDVMDKAEQVLAEAGLRTVSIRGDQTAKQRQDAVDAFQKDPEVSVAVCSLLAAGVQVSLHASSNVVLAELSWTAAEQQAIDRVHRIGQDEPVT